MGKIRANWIRVHPAEHTMKMEPNYGTYQMLYDACCPSKVDASIMGYENKDPYYKMLASL